MSQFQRSHATPVILISLSPAIVLSRARHRTRDATGTAILSDSRNL